MHVRTRDYSCFVIFGLKRNYSHSYTQRHFMHFMLIYRPHTARSIHFPHRRKQTTPPSLLHKEAAEPLVDWSRTQNSVHYVCIKSTWIQLWTDAQICSWLKPSNNNKLCIDLWPFTFWPRKWCPSRVWHGTDSSVPILVSLGPMYAIDRRYI